MKLIQDSHSCAKGLPVRDAVIVFGARVWERGANLARPYAGGRFMAHQWFSLARHLMGLDIIGFVGISL